MTPAERRRLARYNRDVARNYDRLVLREGSMESELARIYDDMARQSREMADELEEGNGE